MQSDPTRFEVCCPRCDVTFPIETRNCVHCGGATAASRAGGVTSSAPSIDVGYRDEAPNFDGLEHAPVRQTSGAPEPHLEDGPPGQPGRFGPVDENSPESGPGRSILGSMGSLIWIALVIALSISNQICSE